MLACCTGVCGMDACYLTCKGNIRHRLAVLASVNNDTWEDETSHNSDQVHALWKKWWKSKIHYP